jgi:hypothetical protein
MEEVAVTLRSGGKRVVIQVRVKLGIKYSR